MERLNISVIVPAFNEEKYIANCLESIQKQLTEDDELIVVDNGSTDKTVEIVKRMAVDLLYEARKGQSYTVSKGFESAKNSIIARVDADTVISEGWVQAIKVFYSKKGRLNNSTAITGPVYLKEFLPLKLGVHQGLAKKYVGHEVLVGSNEAMTKILWKDVKPKMSNDDKTYAEDVEMSIMINKIGGKIDFVPEMRVLTSARWMIRHPFKSYKTWKSKMRKTLSLQ